MKLILKVLDKSYAHVVVTASAFHSYLCEVNFSILTQIDQSRPKKLTKVKNWSFKVNVLWLLGKCF